MNIVQRPIPSTGEMLPLIGIGTWQQFDVGNNAAEKENLTKVLKLMLEKGGTLIDSSPMYGRAEAVVGELTHQLSTCDQYFYATKVWTSGEQNGIRQMEESLKKMQRKTMDLIQVHNLVDWQTHLKTLQRWKDKKLVRYTGVTHYVASAHAQLEQLVRSKAVDFVQFNYSIGERNAERSLLDACKDNGVAVIINEPFEKGELFRMVRDKALPDWAADYDIRNWTQFFLKYILGHEAVNAVIPGTSDTAHLLDNMSAGYGALPDAKARKQMAQWMDGL